MSAAAAPASEADRAKVLATVNGSKVTSGELEESLRSLLYELRRQVYDVERDALENRIDDVLVEQDAKRRNMTAEALADHCRTHLADFLRERLNLTATHLRCSPFSC